MTQQQGIKHSLSSPADGSADGLVAGAAAVLAPLDRHDLPAFLLELPTGRVRTATAAVGRFGLRPGELAPPALVATARRLARRTAAGFGLARLTLPGCLAPRLFRFAPLALPDGAAILFADPAAFDAAPGAPTPAVAPAVPAALRPLLAQPVRVTWEADGEGRLRALSPLFAAALGARAPHLIGRSFATLEDDGLVRDAGAVAHAIATGASFTDLAVFVPAAGADPALDLTLGAVPMLDPARRRVGMRGFGIACASARADAAASNVREEVPPPAQTAPQAPDFGRNVVPLRSATLSPQERSAFSEIARTLAAAIEDWPKPRAVEMPEPSDGPEEMTEEPAPPTPSDEAELLDRLPVGLLVQQDGALTYANRTFLEMTGWPDLAALAEAGGLERVMSREGGGLHALMADGGGLPVEVRLVAAPFLGRPALIHVVRPLNATDDREARASARRAALDMVPWPIFLLEGDGTIRLVNRAGAERLGFPAHELAGEPFTIAVAPEDRAAAVAALDRVALANLSDEIALALRDRTGTLTPGRAAVTRAGADDQLLCVVIGPAAPAVAPALPNPPAPDLLPRLAGRLRAGLAGPLATLRDAGSAGLPAPAEAAFDALAATLDDLSALAEPEPPVPADRCDLARLVRDAVAAHAATARRRRIALRLDAPAQLPVTGHGAFVARLARRMLEEALDATPPGGTVTVSVLSVLEDGEARARLQVSDGGPGLDEPAVAAALDPLSGLPADDRFATAGRPLRLARMAAEAEAAGGILEVRPSSGRGMLASLTLMA
ncbi:PAS domain-containing protein [Xanthobacter sp. KR7-65]|uniref:PAS domain-containing protein n=1 Tax=Xanthobacter sp. KR7-65 TaxID=3156612 RepID=UPI0032B54780